jgi:hypothetical protein
MKWIGISGTWQLTSKQVEEDVRREVKKILLLECVARGELQLQT